MAVTLILDDSSQRFLVSSLAFIMALLVAQTRVETGVHSASEVASAGRGRAHDAAPLPGVRLTAALPSDAELLALADAAAERAYAPYSRFHVGCAVQRDGRVIEA